jgi:hypothetical protein
MRTEEAEISRVVLGDIAHFLQLFADTLGSFHDGFVRDLQIILLVLSVGAIQAVGAVALLLVSLRLLLDLFHSKCTGFVNGRSLAGAEEIGDVAPQLVFEARFGKLAVEGAFNAADAVAGEEGGINVVAELQRDVVVGFRGAHGDGFVAGHGCWVGLVG